MNESSSKIFLVGRIFGRMLFCLFVSFLIYGSSVIFLYGAWHCPSGNCQTAAWVNAMVFLILFSPFFVFAFGAYLCREAAFALTKNKFWRAVILIAFALFPLYLLIGFFIYVANSHS